MGAKIEDQGERIRINKNQIEDQEEETNRDLVKLTKGKEATIRKQAGSLTSLFADIRNIKKKKAEIKLQEDAMQRSRLWVMQS